MDDKQKEKLEKYAKAFRIEYNSLGLIDQHDLLIDIQNQYLTLLESGDKEAARFLEDLVDSLDG